ncbi:MAG: hypothetical protein IKP75_00545 [Oscillospiraceae bacterium]|nr:hypothetical protein [Oscillospiraceae bacterium]
MATIKKRGDSYPIRVSCGYDSKGKQVIQSMTWKPEPKMTAKQIDKELNRQSVNSAKSTTFRSTACTVSGTCSHRFSSIREWTS